jgi:hypothetical protein
MNLAENVLGKFEKWVLKPLKKDIEDPNRSHFNGFILMSVIIDNLASMRYRSELPDRVNGNIGRRYRKFIENYFPSKYKSHSVNLYRGYRCHLVHAFQIKGFDVQQVETARRHHLKRLKSGELCLHSHELLKDIFAAFEKFKSELMGANSKQNVVEAFKKANFHGWAHTEAESA